MLPVDGDCFLDFLPIGALSAHFPKSRQPSDFTKRLFAQLVELDEPTAELWLLSDIEICMLLASEVECEFPTWDTTQNQWAFRGYHLHFERPLLTRVLRWASGAVSEILDCCGLGAFRVWFAHDRT